MSNATPDLIFIHLFIHTVSLRFIVETFVCEILTSSHTWQKIVISFLSRDGTPIAGSEFGLLTMHICF